MTISLNVPSKVNNQVVTENYSIYQGDCIEVVGNLKDNSIHYSIFSPPFSQLYVYSDDPRDMSNNSSDEQFYQHFGYLVSELYRVLKPGRLVSFHCMNLPTLKSRDGFIGIKDFRGDLIRLFQSHGFIYHSEVCIWKDPVVAAVRTKAIGLLHKQMEKDSTISRNGLPDYVVTMRKPGDNPEPVAGKFDHYAGENTPELPEDNDVKKSINIWQQYASPVWMDIKQGNTLQYRSARDNNDERHICCLQLDVIERCLQLWTNPGDIVLSPFMGIGSEGYVSLQQGRKFIGTELKESYFNCAVTNLESVYLNKY